MDTQARGREVGQVGRDPGWLARSALGGQLFQQANKVVYCPLLGGYRVSKGPDSVGPGSQIPAALGILIAAYHLTAAKVQTIAVTL